VEGVEAEASNELDVAVDLVVLVEA